MNLHLPSPVKFREDINGLRAWAVIAVLLFHFSLIGLPGGFAGVDVFFVISGYLMTAIIVGGYERGNFSIWKFYQSRIRRILPALMAVIIVLLSLGWFWLPTVDYQRLGDQAAYALSFISNIYYWLRSGYFDSAAQEKWLLHTWSLAVEAQFYLLYPLFIAVLWRLWQSLKVITLGVLIVFIASLALNLILVNWKPSTAFYLLPTRGWELASGALVFLIAKQYRLPQLLLSPLYWLGWSLVIASFLLINESFAWPGYWAILPVLGTSLIILVNNAHCRLSTNFVAQWLGDRSYSLYLWHWPLVVSLYFVNLQGDWPWVLSFFVLSILLADLSYRFIETPTRRYLSQAHLYKEIAVIGLVGVVIVISAEAVKTTVFEGRVGQKVEQVAAEDQNKFFRYKECFIDHSEEVSELKTCRVPKNTANQEIKAVLLGDSHSLAILSAVAEAVKKYAGGGQVLYLGNATCPTLLDVHYRSGFLPNKRDWCADFNQKAYEVISNLPKDIPLIIINRGGLYLKGETGMDISDSSIIEFNKDYPESYSFLQKYTQAKIDDTCKFESGRKTYLVRPIPEMVVNVPNAQKRNLMLGIHQETEISMESYQLRQSENWKIQDDIAEKCGVKILNPLPYLCDDDSCYGSKNGRPLYFDDDHLSEYGNKLLVPMFENIFK